MPEEARASRIAELTEQARNLERRQAELAQAAEDLKPPEEVHDADLPALRHELEQALEQGPLPRRKATLHAVVEYITVESPTAIRSTCRVRQAPTSRSYAEQMSGASRRSSGSSSGSRRVLGA